tara:strand:+ start:2468 stop:2869 length:402 start_codon:yes stop_codon:yes gene_type:complete
MKCLNRVDLIGNLGNDPEHRTFDDGTSTCTFSVATSESWNDKKTKEKKERTEWHRCVAWRNLADVVHNHLKKGSKVWLSGKLQTRKYEQNGVTKYSTEVVVNEVIFMDRPKEDGAPEKVVDVDQMQDTDDLPF